MQNVEDAMDVDISSSPSAIDAVLSAGAATTASAAAAAITSTATSTAGAVATVAAQAVMDAAGNTNSASPNHSAESNLPEALRQQVVPPPPTPSSDASPKQVPFQPAAAWDAHLDSPGTDVTANKMAQTLRRAGLGLTSSKVLNFIDSVEFVSLGCFCAVANALQLVGLKCNTYPFDWVRSSLEGVMHCIDMEFEDFLTYSTYNVQNGYVVFGGTRWGGSFWHHNLEVPLTKSDMSRRVSRFYGRGSVPAKTPRFFARVVNSTREIDSALRLRDTLKRALPESEELFLLLIVDLQPSTGPVVIDGPRGHGVLVYTISEQETVSALSQGQQSFQLCSETYAKAIGFAVRYWSGEETWEAKQTFSSIREASRSLVQFDGGDPGRELFTPKKFYGQLFLGDEDPFRQMQSLLAKARSQVFLLPEGVNPSLPFFVECFGKRLSVLLPPCASCGQVLNIWINDTTLTASVCTMNSGQMNFVGPASVQELEPIDMTS